MQPQPIIITINVEDILKNNDLFIKSFRSSTDTAQSFVRDALIDAKNKSSLRYKVVCFLKLIYNKYKF